MTSAMKKNSKTTAKVAKSLNEIDKQDHSTTSQSSEITDLTQNKTEAVDKQNLSDDEIVSFLQDEAKLTKGKTNSDLTAAEKARIERNRQKALLLRQARLSNQQLHGDPKRTANCNRIIDSGGGFLIEENDAAPSKVRKVEEPAPVISGELNVCLDCDKPFLDSYLLTTYDYPVCDKCRDAEDKHSVITKTQAKELYLLSESDMTVREPILKCVIRKNPRNNRWGDMKLFLKLQIEERALEVWGTPEALEEERELRETKKEDSKRKKYNKKMKKLRQEVRSSLYQVKTSGHEHVFGAETQVDGDNWKKTCSLCGHEMIFEKM